MNLKNLKNSWILSSGMIGCENQCLGVIERLGIKTKIINLKPSITLSYLTIWVTYYQSSSPTSLARSSNRSWKKNNSLLKIHKKSINEKMQNNISSRSKNKIKKF